MPVDLASSSPLGCAPQGSKPAPRAPVSDRPSSLALQGPAALAGIPILVVDDDPPSARLARVLLEAAGADVRTAYSGEEALAMLAAFPARVFVVDLILPGISGFLLARRLKAAAPHVVVLAISVVHGADTERLALESGCVALVHKPIDVQSFAETVARHLGRAA